MKLSVCSRCLPPPKSWVRSLAAVLGLALASASFAHQPEGVVYPVFQWPEYGEPVIDGDLWEWDYVPEYYRISSSICPDYYGDYSSGAYGLESEIIISWSESQNRIYILEVRLDDDFILADPDAFGDAIDIQLDGDHGGEPIYFSQDEYPDDEERSLNKGRRAQSYVQFLPGSTRGPEDTWAWFWVSESTWYDQPEYMDMAYVFEGQLRGEGLLVTESSWTLWDDFIWNDPDASVQTDLEEGHIIGLGWIYHDVNDEGDRSVFYCSGPEAEDQYRTSASISDFLLEPLDEYVWGYTFPPYCPGPEVDDDSVVIWQSWKSIKAASSAIYSLSFSPDGHTLASASGKIRLWDVSTGTLQATLEEPGDIVAFSPDGLTLASGSSYGTIWLWDVRTGQLEESQLDSSLTRLHLGHASSLAFSPDGRTLAVGGYWPSISLWDVRTGKLDIKHTFYYGDPIGDVHCGSVAFSPDGKTLACGRETGALRLWEVGREGRVSKSGFESAAKRTDLPFQDPTYGNGSVSFSPDGSKLAYGITTGNTALMDMASRERLIRIEDRGEVAFSPDGHTLAIGNDCEPVIRLWDVETGQHKATLKGHLSTADKINSIAFSPDGTLASASDDGILLWDMSPFVTDPSEITVVSAVEPAVPSASGLDAIAPNPFNTTTRISYSMAAPGPVRLEIYNTLGQRVRTLVDEGQPPGSYRVLWDARDQEGAMVSAGVYLARLHYRGGAETRRLLYLK